MTTSYDDPLLTIEDGVLTIRRYFLPIGGCKRIGLGTIRSADERRLGRFSGRWRLWGTSSPRYWLNQDFGRHRKDIAFVLDVGKRVEPVVTPDDPRAFRKALADAGVRTGQATGTAAAASD